MSPKQTLCSGLVRTENRFDSSAGSILLWAAAGDGWLDRGNVQANTEEVLQGGWYICWPKGTFAQTSYVLKELTGISLVQGRCAMEDAASHSLVHGRGGGAWGTCLH